MPTVLLKKHSLHAIYKITCTPTGEFYIGQARSLFNRWEGHVTHLKTQTHHNQALQRAWNTYGKEAFEFTVLELCPVHYLNYRERCHIHRHKPPFNWVRPANDRRVTPAESRRRRLEMEGIRLTLEPRMDRKQDRQAILYRLARTTNLHTLNRKLYR